MRGKRKSHRPFRAHLMTSTVPPEACTHSCPCWSFSSSTFFFGKQQSDNGYMKASYLQSPLFSSQLFSPKMKHNSVFCRHPWVKVDSCKAVPLKLFKMSWLWMWWHCCYSPHICVSVSRFMLRSSFFGFLFFSWSSDIKTTWLLITWTVNKYTV